MKTSVASLYFLLGHFVGDSTRSENSRNFIETDLPIVFVSISPLVYSSLVDF